MLRLIRSSLIRKSFYRLHWSIASPTITTDINSRDSPDVLRFKQKLRQYYDVFLDLGHIKKEGIFVPTFLSFVTGYAGLTSGNTFVISPTFLISLGATIFTLSYYYKLIPLCQQELDQLKSELEQSYYQYPELTQLLTKPQ